MNKNLKFIFCFVGFIFLILGAVVSFNFYVDPMCYYRCESVNLTRHTQNVYYQAAQMVAANPDANILVMGSSRGETTPSLWIQNMTGKKTLNLSKGGAGLLLKIALLRTAEEYKLPIKKVIWVADYFEVAGDVTDVKVRQTPVLRKHIVNELKAFEGFYGFNYYLERLQRLFDHNSFEASLQQLKNKDEDLFDAKGSGSKIEYEKCASEGFKGNITAELLPKAVDGSYVTFSTWLRASLNQKFIEFFKKEILELESKGIEVTILVPPFHSEILKKIVLKYPETKSNYQSWLNMINSLKSPKVHVLSFWDGIPSDNSGPSFWEDGAHPTCKSMMLMLQKDLNP